MPRSRFGLSCASLLVAVLLLPAHLRGQITEDEIKAMLAANALSAARAKVVRDAYLQHRRSAIHDGNPPREADESASLPSANLLTIEPLESTWTMMLVGAPEASDVDAVNASEPTTEPVDTAAASF